MADLIARQFAGAPAVAERQSGPESQGSPALFELEAALARQSPAARASTLRGVTQLFLSRASLFSDEHTQVFDSVFLRLVTGIEGGARLELARALADLPNAPAGTIMRLARDEIGIARPVLVQSTKLSEEELAAIAVACGRDHMLAISERPRLTPVITDVLVTRGDRVVLNAVGANQGAQFSDVGLRTLIGRAQADEALQEILRHRRDVPAQHLASLAAMANLMVQRKLQAPASPEAAVANSPARVIQPPQPAATPARSIARPAQDAINAAAKRIAARLNGRQASEADLVEHLDRQETAETICVLAAMASLNVGTIQQILKTQDHDSLLVIGRRQSLSWETLVRVFQQMAPIASAERLGELESKFQALMPGSADQMLRFMRLREAATASPVRRSR